MVFQDPSAEIALQQKKELALNVLKDIARLSDEVAPTAAFVIRPLASALLDRAEHLRPHDIGLAAGPELFRWLGHAGLAVHRGDEARVGAAINSLPPLLLGRLIASQTLGGRFLVPKCNGSLVIPQASAVHSIEASGSLIEVELRPDEVVAASECLNRSTLSDGIDGATAATRCLGDGPIFFHQRGFPLFDMVADLSEIASAPVGQDEALTIISPDDFDGPEVAPIVANMAEGLNLLRRLAPESASEVEAVLDAVTLVTGRRFVGGSDIWYQGVAVLNPDVDWSPTTYTDHLVHEGAHLLLHAVNELNPLLRNPDAMGAASPIREDPRPLYGILHSTFVFMRLVMFFRRAAQAIGSDEALFRLHRHLLGFYKGLTEIERFADFTPSGSRLFRGMLEAREDFAGSLPEPDPRYYRRIGKDYIV